MLLRRVLRSFLVVGFAWKKRVLKRCSQLKSSLQCPSGVYLRWATSRERVIAESLAQRAKTLKKVNLAWKFQSRLKISISLENFNLDLQNSPQKNRGLVGGSLEIFNLA